MKSRGQSSAAVAAHLSAAGIRARRQRFAKSNPIASNALRQRIEELEKKMTALQDRGIESTPGVCGGSARIVRTRIPIWILEGLRRQGKTEAELLQSYPALTAQDLVDAWHYVAANKQAIDAEIAENDAV